ncbi:hypothetical protein [Hungatella sp.]|uniref:hypothetical protein n=1 Tax=Hungatella sp. TaxID=2613924 RepID=UPI0039952B54
MVDLRGNPFYLDEAGERWVKETETAMTPHEKVCQLFADPLMGKSREELIQFLEEYPLAAIPFRARLWQRGGSGYHGRASGAKNSLSLRGKL